MIVHLLATEEATTTNSIEFTLQSKIPINNWLRNAISPWGEQSHQLKMITKAPDFQYTDAKYAGQKATSNSCCQSIWLTTIRVNAILAFRLFMLKNTFSFLSKNTHYLTFS